MSDGRMLAAALAYAERGWSVFPCRPGDKAPALPKCSEADRLKLSGAELAEHAAACPNYGHGLHDAVADAATIRQWWQARSDANIGVATGDASGIVVVDVDDHNALDRLQYHHEQLPETTTQRTADGFHLVFQRPAAGLRNSASKLAPGIDVRGDYGYIVAAPSLHPSGVQYEWTTKVPPAELPGWMLELLAPSEAPPGSGPSPPAGGQPDGTAWGRAVLEREVGRVVAAPDKTRNDTLFRAACKVSEAAKGGYLDDAGARQALTLAAERAGLDSSEVPPTIESAWQRTTPRHPDADGAPGPTPVAAPAWGAPQPAGQDEPQASGMLTWADLEQLPEPTWILPGLLPDGFTTLIGPENIGKTFVALDWLLSAAARGRPVVYCAGEGANGIHKRMSAWMKAHPDQAGITDMLRVRALSTFPRLLEDQSVRSMVVDLDAMEAPPALIVVDTWARALVGGDENKYQDVQRGISVLDAMRERYDASVLVLHHVAKPGGGAPAPQRGRGHGALDGAADAIWQLEETSGERRLRLVCRKMKESERPKPCELLLAHSGDALVPTPSAAGPTLVSAPKPPDDDEDDPDPEVF